MRFVGGEQDTVKAVRVYGMLFRIFVLAVAYDGICRQLCTGNIIQVICGIVGVIGQLGQFFAYRQRICRRHIETVADMAIRFCPFTFLGKCGGGGKDDVVIESRRFLHTERFVVGAVIARARVVGDVEVICRGKRFIFEEIVAVVRLLHFIGVADGIILRGKADVIVFLCFFCKGGVGYRAGAENHDDRKYGDRRIAEFIQRFHVQPPKDEFVF